MINFSIFMLLENTPKNNIYEKIFFCYILVFLTVPNLVFSQSTKISKEKHTVHRYNTIQS